MEAKKPSIGTVIFMHGLGDSGEGWMDGMTIIQKALPHVKFILPHAYVLPHRSMELLLGQSSGALTSVLSLLALPQL